MEELKSEATEEAFAKKARMPKEARLCLTMYTYVGCESRVVSLPSWWRARPGLLSAIQGAK